MILDYIDTPCQDRVSHEDFLHEPFTAFLRQAVHLSDAFNHCKRHFPKKKNGDYNKDSLHSLQEIASPILAGLLSNLELFQRSVYGGLFDLTHKIPDYTPSALVKNLKAANIDIGIQHVIGYRGTKAATGDMVADALPGWHEPRKVNNYFRGMLNVEPFYTDQQDEELSVLWQLRHSIVHTGGTLTFPDSQKLRALGILGNRAVVFRPQMVDAVVIWFHTLLKAVHSSFFPKVKGRFKEGYSGETKSAIDRLFALDSPRKAWLKDAGHQTVQL